MIYLDHAAATPISEKVLTAMQPYYREKFFNPSAAYLPAREVSQDYSAAKSAIAHAIGAKGSDLVMTAGATEANNLAFTVMRARDTHNTHTPSPTALVLATEHDSVRQIATRYSHAFINVDQTGRINLDDLAKKIDDSVRLISISLVNNELGAIQPLAEVAELIREVKLDRLRRGVSCPLVLHSDASQALNLLNVNVARLGVDLMTISSAKIYGPKGVGALYVGHDVRLSPLSYGGGQENGLRAGTENVPGVIGFATAMTEAVAHLNGNRKKYTKWKELLLANLSDYVLINKGKTLANFITIAYPGLDAERLVFLLEARGVLVATGAACAASKSEHSHVLAAILSSASEIAGSLRITLGETNDKSQIIEAAKIINEVVRDEKQRLGVLKNA